MSRRQEWLYTNGLRLALMVSCFGFASTNLGWSIAEFEATSSVDDINAAKKRLDALGPTAKVTMDGTRLTEIVIQDGSLLTSDDLTLFGRLTDLKKLQIFN